MIGPGICLNIYTRNREEMDDIVKQAVALPLEQLKLKYNTVSQVPFFLRAWWLREYKVSDDSPTDPAWVTLPLWSSHTDPICDAVCLDYEAP